MSPEVITLIGGLGSSAAAVAVMWISWKIMLTMSERWALEMRQETQRYEAIIKDLSGIIQANAAAMGRLEHAIDSNRKAGETR